MPDQKIYFEPIDPKTTVARVAHAQYARDFSGENPPYEATAEEWENHLLRTGLFREVKKSAKKE